MPRNGAGQYSLPNNTFYPGVNGVTVQTADANTTHADIATALTASVAADGQTPMTGDLNMGNNQVTSMAAGAALTDAANINDVQSGRLHYLTAVAGTDTITASLSYFTTYAAGNVFRFVSAGANTGATTLNINGIGAKAITKAGTTALVGGEIQSGATIDVMYDGTQFQIVNIQPLASTAEVQAGTNAVKLLTPASLRAGAIVSGTPTSPVGVVAVNYTSIPSWVKRITIHFESLSTDGTSNLHVQIGDSGGIETSGYLGSASSIALSTVASVNHTAGFGLTASTAATSVLHGSMVLTLIDASTNTWVSSSTVGASDTTGCQVAAGSKSLSATLDRLRITTVSGTPLLDNGKVNILYE